jgi:molybdopterin-guanine dinucleotide biosynthesis protein A
MYKDEFSLIILSGGNNSRYQGKNKAFIKYNGISFLDRILLSLKDLFEEIIIVSNTQKEYERYNFAKTTPDIYQHIGPLGGIHAGLKKSSKAFSLIVSCDTPFIERIYAIALMNAFLKNKQIVTTPLLDKNREPLFAIYSQKILTDLENHLNTSSKKSVIGFLNTINTGIYIPFQTKSFKASVKNINSPDELKELPKLISE